MHDLNYQRLTDNDHRIGPITYGRANWKVLRAVWSGDITVYAFNHCARVSLPRFLRLPGDYGFSLSDGFFNLYYGQQTQDSSTEKRWGYFLPWTQWRFVRHSLYSLSGELFWTESNRYNYESVRRAEESCPKASFEIDDYDGKRITATTFIEDREWHFGTGWFKWLSWFRRPKVRRSLSINFSEEVGPEKGSWKGGVMGTGIDMLPGELHEAAFQRFCELDHRSKFKGYKVKFVGPADAPQSPL